MKLLLLCLLVLSSCGSFRDVKVLGTKPEGDNCEIINRIHGINEFGSEKAAIKDLRNNARKKGANAVFIEEIVPNGKEYKAYGSIYKCEEN